VPDFKTIADFRRDSLAALKGVCREFTVVCKKLELFGRELVAIAGSKFKAVNNRKRNFSEPRLRKAIAAIAGGGGDLPPPWCGSSRPETSAAQPAEKSLNTAS